MLSDWLTASLEAAASLVLCWSVTRGVLRWCVVWVDPAAVLAVAGLSLWLVLVALGSRRLW